MDDYFSRKTAIDILLRIQRRVWEADVPGTYEEHHRRMQALINYITANIQEVKRADAVEPSASFQKGYATAMADMLTTVNRIAEDRTDRLIAFNQETYDELNAAIESLAREADK